PRYSILWGGLSNVRTASKNASKGILVTSLAKA
ncbi:hypothetical protein CP8484711_2029B, partial [Chlamydia psittaci 84-8471/1]